MGCLVAWGAGSINNNVKQVGVIAELADRHPLLHMTHPTRPSTQQLSGLKTSTGPDSRSIAAGQHLTYFCPLINGSPVCEIGRPSLNSPTATVTLPSSPLLHSPTGCQHRPKKPPPSQLLLPPLTSSYTLIYPSHNYVLPTGTLHR